MIDIDEGSYKMKAFERREKILQRLSIKNRVEVAELASLFNVSMETIRRDLEILEKDRDIKKVHGGAVKPKTYRMEEYLFQLRMADHIEDKKQIAKVAASYIKDGDVIALESGTTILAMVPYLRGKDITIVTNSIPVLNQIIVEKLEYLMKKIIVLGGEFNERSLCTYGELSFQILDQIHISKAFLSSQGFTVNEGFSNYSMRESLFAKHLISRSEKSYLLLDESKVNTNSFFTIAPPHQVDVIISTAPVPPRFASRVPNTDWIYVENGKPHKNQIK